MKTIYLTEKQLSNAINNFLSEGIDVDFDDKMVSYNPSHENNIDTNSLSKPHLFSKTVKGEKVISIFNKTGDHHLINALKNYDGWTFKNGKNDIMPLLRRFVKVTKEIHQHYDTIIMIPSNNELNNIVFSYLTRIMSFNYKIKNFFRKLSVDEVIKRYYNEQIIDNMFPSEQAMIIKQSMQNAFERMKTENNGIFSYKYITNLPYRGLVLYAVEIMLEDNEMMRDTTGIVNGKNVLVFDDVVTTGKTISEAAQAIRNMFNPKSITFLTLF